jgi:hypothetical protein
MFDTPCLVDRPDVSDDQALAALCEELREEFAAAGVVRYAVAYPARATITLQASPLHRDRRTCEVVTVEAHEREAHLYAHREIILTAGAYRLTALSPIEEGAATRFGSLL